jgi:glycerophosphoryl diester phosphodiesterase
MLPISVPANFRIIAHRGASAYAPENTLAAFDLALRMGVDEVELDTQLTSDGVVVLCHDRTLARYGHGPGVVERMSSTELLALDMGSWFSPFHFGAEPMLTLADLFARFGSRFCYHVEIKGQAPGLVAAVAQLIAQHNLAEQCIITSFGFASLAAMQQAAPHLRRGWLVEQIDDSVLTRAQALALFQLCPDAAQLSAASVQRARTVVPEVRAWGLSGNNRQVIDLIHRVIDSGCDGMTMNWPDWVCHVST